MRLFYQKQPCEAEQNMSEEEKRMRRCCFTGHRPEKLIKSEKVIKAALRKEIKLAIQDGLTVFITGMARGVDLWAAEIVLEFKKRNKSIKLICAIPHEGFETRWSVTWKQLYQYVLDNADLVRVISKGYHPGVYQIRNEWMVNHSARVIAVCRYYCCGCCRHYIHCSQTEIQRRAEVSLG